MPFWSRPPTSAPSSSSSSDPRDNRDDPELRELLEAIDEESKKAVRDSAKHVEYNTAGDPNFRSGFEDTMNCLTAFDDMYYCYSLGGQWSNGAYAIGTRYSEAGWKLGEGIRIAE